MGAVVGPDGRIHESPIPGARLVGGTSLEIISIVPGETRHRMASTDAPDRGITRRLVWPGLAACLP